jgi:hypothetical protein
LAENQCILTSEGITARDELCQLLFGTSQGKGSQLWTITKLDRGKTIAKIMGRKKGGIQWQKIEQFFEKLIGHLSQEWERGEVRDSRARKYLESPNIKLYWKEAEPGEVPTSLDSSRTPLPSKNQQMAEALMLLDYVEQIPIFCNRLYTESNLDIIAVQAYNDEGTILQKTLVKRLSQFLEGGEPYQIVPITVDKHIRNGGINSFWNKISPYFIRDLELINANDVIEAICRKCITQPIIFVLYEFPKMGRCIEPLMQEFWHPLTQHLTGRFRNTDKRILLLLTGDQDWSDVIEALRVYSPCILPELNQINSDDIKNWLLQPKVCQLRNQITFEDSPLLLDKITGWGDRSYRAIEAMELVCEAFSLSTELEEFQQYWELSGDLVA